jgi:hypothetical protein
VIYVDVFIHTKRRRRFGCSTSRVASNVVKMPSCCWQQHSFVVACIINLMHLTIFGRTGPSAVGMQKPLTATLVRPPWCAAQQTHYVQHLAAHCTCIFTIHDAGCIIVHLIQTSCQQSNGFRYNITCTVHLRSRSTHKSSVILPSRFG